MHDHHQHLSTEGWTEWIPPMVISLIAFSYLCAALTSAKAKAPWPGFQCASFIFGMALLAAAFMPAIMQAGHHDLRIHMVQHLLIAMFAPIFLVLGAPVTLLLKTLPAKVARAGTTILKSRLFYSLTHPFTAAIVNTGGMFLLYLTPLYSLSLASQSLHWFIHIHFLLAGYLFAWSLIGLDPVPRRTGHRTKILVLLLSMGLHAFLSKFMYAYGYPLNTPHAQDQIQEAARLMYYWGDLSELILVVIVFYTWYRRASRSAPPPRGYFLNGVTCIQKDSHQTFS